MSGRYISPAGATHLKQAATRTCRCWKVTRVGMAPFGLTSLDRVVPLDDGFGSLTYRAHRGYTPYDNEATADLSVDNSEMQVLIAEFDMDGITLAAIHRGDYDDAAYVEYLVCYEEPAYVIAMLSSGTLGKVRQIDGIECFPELRSLTQTLKQRAIIEKGSVGCRVFQFGDERCKLVVADEWVVGIVTAVGVETDRTFTIEGDDVQLVDDYYRPGVVLFTSGANAGRTYEIESYTAAGVVTFSIPTELPIAEDDELEIRRDCTRQWAGHNSCETYENRLNYRGEPMRPVADSTGLMLPGAGSSGGGGGDVQTVPE
jgi:uncharacterized phage protein (TIGR02218 family)